MKKDGSWTHPWSRVGPCPRRWSSCKTFIRVPPKDVHPLQSDNVMLEDIYACEAVQNGMGSPKCEIGPLSKWESALTFYQRQILDYVPTNF